MYILFYGQELFNHTLGKCVTMECVRQRSAVQCEEPDEQMIGTHNWRNTVHCCIVNLVGY